MPDPHPPLRAQTLHDALYMIMPLRSQFPSFHFITLWEVIPKEFDPRYLPKYTAHNVGWWDETHPKLKHGTGGAQHGAKMEVSYPRDEQGNIDTDNGTYSEKESKNIVPK